MQVSLSKWMNPRVWWEIAETEQSLISECWGHMENGKGASRLGMTLDPKSKKVWRDWHWSSAIFYIILWGFKSFRKINGDP